MECEGRFHCPCPDGRCLQAPRLGARTLSRPPTLLRRGRGIAQLGSLTDGTIPASELSALVLVAPILVAAIHLAPRIGSPLPDQGHEAGTELPPMMPLSLQGLRSMPVARVRCREEGSPCCAAVMAAAAGAKQTKLGLDKHALSPILTGGLPVPPPVIKTHWLLSWWHVVGGGARHRPTVLSCNTRLLLDWRTAPPGVAPPTHGTLQVSVAGNLGEKNVVRVDVVADPISRVRRKHSR